MNRVTYVLARLIEVVLNAINRKRKKDYADDPASAIANGDRVQQSDETFADLAKRSKRD